MLPLVFLLKIGEKNKVYLPITSLFAIPQREFKTVISPVSSKFEHLSRHTKK